MKFNTEKIYLIHNIVVYSIFTLVLIPTTVSKFVYTVSDLHWLGSEAAYDYWINCQAIGYLSKIRIPTFLLHAQDDPIVPIAPYLDFDWSTNKRLILELTRRGGHVGFHAEEKYSYHLYRVLEFFKNLV